MNPSWRAKANTMADANKPVPWSQRFIRTIGPGGFSGTSFGDWLMILFRAGFAVDVRYWPRAAFITGNSLFNSCYRVLERWQYGSAITNTNVPPPLFVLGYWRSGTTHLHNLLAVDDRFAFPNTYQVLYPHTFLMTESMGAAAMAKFMPSTRPMDNVKAGAQEPQEDEFALVASGLSCMLGQAIFPRRYVAYHRYLCLTGLTPREREVWKEALLLFLKKLTIKYQRPLILKSPAHMGRLDVLLEMFPDAKFVFIHRDPFEVYQSNLHTWQRVLDWWTLQTFQVTGKEILRDYAEVHAEYFAQRPRLRENQLCEIGYDDLVRDPIAQLERAYRTLDLPELEYARPKFVDYLAGLSGYERNSFTPLSSTDRDRIASAWSRSFEEWGYSKNGLSS
jgi:hypothetical protein